jgi:SPP1 gp7 family putative phage head morphogenesis protein
MLLPDARARTLALLRALPRDPPRRRLPVQVLPDAIVREYTRELLDLVVQTDLALAPLRADLPGLLASAARDRGERADAGEGKRVQELIARARGELEGALKPERLEALASAFAVRTATYQRVQLNRQVKAALGVDPILGDQALAGAVEGFAHENASLIKDVSAQMIARTEQAATRALAGAVRHEQLAKELDAVVGYGENRSKLIARDQVLKLYGKTNAARQKELGVTSFIWRTVHDRRVRERHVALDGRVFKYSDPPDEGLPGEPIKCRCYAEPVLDDILAGLGETKRPRSRPAAPPKPRAPRAPRGAPKLTVTTLPPLRAPAAPSTPAVKPEIKALAHALREAVSAGGSPSSPREIREGLNAILKRVGFFDVDSSLADAGKYAVKPQLMFHARGLHWGLSGMVEVQESVHTGAIDFFEKQAGAKQLDRVYDRTDAIRSGNDARTLIHEAIHGHGGIRCFGDGTRRVVEEVTTETAARYVMREQLGQVRWNAAPMMDGSYQDWIDGVARAHARAKTITPGSVAEMSESYRAVEEASVKFKRLPTPAGNIVGMEVDEQTMIDAYADQFDFTPAERREFIDRLKQIPY